ncbi:MAG TPA: ABC transporter ATP-binding protein [Pirellulales bacterium]|jgi:lipoprotein-releasing system ATP-binding protein|nr:ABC transporter ATP-binding protein [Pirellulales bacterium]
MNDFQRLVERERQLAQERGASPAAAGDTARGTFAAPRELNPAPAEAPHMRLESWREPADDMEYLNDIRIPSLATLRREPAAGGKNPAARREGKPRQLAAVGLRKSYRKGSVEIPVLRGVDLEVGTGEFVAIVGQSGCGKSTLLHLLGTLDAPDSGEVRFENQRIDNRPARARDHLRNEKFGMIFQFYHLLPELTTLENVLMPLMIRQSFLGYRVQRKKHVAAASGLLELVGLAHRLKHKPRELSGGEMQRAAIARALITQPQVLLADEPTGNLDHSTGQEILKILRTLNHDRNLTIVMVTHDLGIAQQADRIVRLAEGRVVRQ